LVKFDGTISGTSEEFLAVVIPIWWERTRHLPPRLLATTRGIIGLVPWDAAGVPGGYKPVAVNATAMLKLAARARIGGGRREGPAVGTGRRRPRLRERLVGRGHERAQPV